MNSEVQPEFVVNLGDLIQDINQHEQDRKHFQDVVDWLKKLQMPVYHLIGNHDVKTLPESEICEILDYDKTYYSWDFDNFHFVALGFKMTGDQQENPADILAELPPAQLTWLEQDLTQTNKHTVIFEHYGLVDDDMQGNFWFEGEMAKYAMLSNRQKVREVLEKSGKVRAVFTAHQHWNRFHVINKIPYFTTNSLVENFRNDGTPAATWTLVELDDQQIQVDIQGNDPFQRILYQKM